MATILIPTIQDDIHAAAVARVLEEMFCEFLVSRDPGFRRSPAARSVAMASVLDDAIAMIARDRDAHAQPERYPHIVQEA